MSGRPYAVQGGEWGPYAVQGGVWGPKAVQGGEWGPYAVQGGVWVICGTGWCVGHMWYRVVSGGHMQVMFFYE